MLALIGSFTLIALAYSMVGFGGGSSYIALLAVSGVSFHFIPKISLFCNLAVVLGGCWQFYRKGLFQDRRLLPFIFSSVPFAFLGGQFPLKEKVFFAILCGSLIIAGIRLLFVRDREAAEIQPPKLGIAITVGSGLGLLSGMVGIGGGIFLSPILINLGWARSKNAAACASLFILLNSIAGLAGQFTKNPALPEWSLLAPLLCAVVIGGQIGTRIGTHSRMTYALVQKGTAVLVLFIAGKLLLQTVSG